MVQKGPGLKTHGTEGTSAGVTWYRGDQRWSHMVQRGPALESHGTEGTRAEDTWYRGDQRWSHMVQKGPGLKTHESPCVVCVSITEATGCDAAGGDTGRIWLVKNVVMTTASPHRHASSVDALQSRR
uniref:Uncharacterized protein n=1 Tax=Knipowitschia caucasica TaxID=637954 RepID=A0AAV2KP39_KNICA